MRKVQGILGALLVLFFVAPVFAEDFEFEAKRRSIIHSEPKSDSANLGYVEVGQKAKVTADRDKKWVKVKHGNVEGWVFARRGVISATGTSTAEPEMKFWFGNMHAHTSEGSKENNVSESTHEDAFAYAMDDNKGNLDFLAVTPHNHYVKKQTYADLLVTTRAPEFDVPGKFVPIAGQEYSSISKGNHVNVFEIGTWIDKGIVKNGEFKKLFDEFIPAHKTNHTFAQFNHPSSSNFSGHGKKEYGRDDYVGTDGSLDAWIAATDQFVQLIEVVSAPSHGNQTNRPHFNEDEKRLNAWLWALSKGWHLAPAANQDNHRKNWGSATDSRTVAVAPALTRNDIISAFQQRRVYATEDSTLQVTFKAGSVWMGSEVAAETFGGFEVMANDPEEPDARYTFELFEGHIGGDALKHSSAPLLSQTLKNGETGYFYPEEVEDGSFYFVCVTQTKTPADPNGTEDNAWTAPIWIKGDMH